jgi:hypothetical protein
VTNPEPFRSNSHSYPDSAKYCESCGARATVTLDDGSTWCESCDVVARCLDATDHDT